MLRRFSASLSLILLTLSAVGRDFHAEFEAHPLNVSIKTVTECKGSNFYAVNLVPINPDWSSVDFYRVRTPHGERCTVLGYVMRNADPVFGDPDADYEAEAVAIIQED